MVRVWTILPKALSTIFSSCEITWRRGVAFRHRCGGYRFPRAEVESAPYVADSNRRTHYPQIQFEFLGFRFRPRRAKSRYGRLKISRRARIRYLQMREKNIV